jgi:hypothetical protein
VLLNPRDLAGWLQAVSCYPSCDLPTFTRTASPSVCDHIARASTLSSWGSRWYKLGVVVSCSHPSLSCSSSASIPHIASAMTSSSLPAAVDSSLVSEEGTIPFVIGTETYETWYKVFGKLAGATQPPLIVLHGGPGTRHILYRERSRANNTDLRYHARLHATTFRFRQGW